MLCVNCNNETKNAKFCSLSCSASHNNKGIVRNGTAREMCINCHINRCNESKKFCNGNCRKEYLWNKKLEAIKNGTLISTKNLKKYLIMTVNKCQECPITDSYNNKPISLEMDHIDGDPSNNVIGNVRLLCPNCHSQTSNFKAKNINNPKGKEYRKLRYSKSIK